MNNTNNTPDVVVQCTWSGNRANAWDTDGNKWTHAITTACRQRLPMVTIY